jgi:hypothetical protein
VPEPSQRVWSHSTRDGAGVFLTREAGFGAIGHVVAPEPTSAGRQDPELWDTWRRTVACPTLYLDLKLVHGGTRSVGYLQ